MTEKEAQERLLQHRDWGFSDLTMQALHMGGEALGKQIEKSPVEKQDTFGDYVLTCPTCGRSAIVNPYRQMHGVALYPHCPWCGQKLEGGQQ